MVRPGMPQIPTIVVESEAELPAGWVYRVLVREGSGPPAEYEVRLHWADHDYWSGGAVPPSRVIEALFRLLLDRTRTIPGRFDAATARRWFPDLDAQLQQRL
jgi:hypothetical protein